jgi:plastocyanin
MLRKLIISLPLFVTLAAAAAIITTPLLPTASYGQLPPQQPTTTYSDDGSGSITFENGTKKYFAHNYTGPEYLHENGTIFHVSNLTEVELDLNNTSIYNENIDTSSLELQGPLAPDRIANLSAQDPEFAAFQEMLDMCRGYNLPPNQRHLNNATISYDQCVRTMQQSVDKWCSLAAYQEDKCETASLEFSTFTAFNEIMNILGLDEEDSSSTPQSSLEDQSFQPPPRLPQSYTVGIDPKFEGASPDAEVRLSPLRIEVGDKVTWRNEDTQPHTVTSGQTATPDERFDSGVLAPGATFEHTFTEAGEYPYFCLLHPNQVGTVSVN